MGVAYYPAFECETPGFDPSTEIGGKPLAREMEDLGEICARLQVSDLMSFYSESLKESFDLIGEEVPEGMKEEPIKWTEPAEGLRTLDALIAYLTGHPAELQNSPRILEDLQSLRAILDKASELKTRFRLRLDM